MRRKARSRRAGRSRHKSTVARWRRIWRRLRGLGRGRKRGVRGRSRRWHTRAFSTTPAPNPSAHFFQTPKFAFSYQTMLKQTLGDGRTIGNITKYSVTTSKHQKKAGVRSCDILLDNVPQGADNLAEIAKERGLIRITSGNPRRRKRRTRR